MDKWTTTKSESLVDNHWVKIRKDSVVLPNEQKIDDFYVITINNAAAIVAIDEDGNCILKKEYRYCYDRDLIEVPAGTFEEDETDGLAVAKRELLEETGYESDEWQYLGATVESSAKLTNYMHIYFANHCKKVSEQHLDATEDVEVIVVPFEKAIDMVMNAPFLPAVYEKYKERGGRPVFHPKNLAKFRELFSEVYLLASSSDYIRDMRLNEKLSMLLTMLMEESWHPEDSMVSKKRMELTKLKEYLDEHYTEKISLDELAIHFFINKYYLTKIFKETYGTTINNYIIAKRITRAKQMLRFTDMTLEEIAIAVGMNGGNYFSRMFKKIEGISPREYRKQW